MAGNSATQIISLAVYKFILFSLHEFTALIRSIILKTIFRLASKVKFPIHETLYAPNEVLLYNSIKSVNEI